nr:hypothetical protein CFP56_21753 [Quercus suber]
MKRHRIVTYAARCVTLTDVNHARRRSLCAINGPLMCLSCEHTWTKEATIQGSSGEGQGKDEVLGLTTPSVPGHGDALCLRFTWPICVGSSAATDLYRGHPRRRG